MPVKTKVVGKKIRVVESRTGKIAKRGGKAVDSGGYPKGPKGKAKAVRQVTAINISTGHVPGVKPKKRR